MGLVSCFWRENKKEEEDFFGRKNGGNGRRFRDYWQGPSFGISGKQKSSKETNKKLEAWDMEEEGEEGEEEVGICFISVSSFSSYNLKISAYPLAYFLHPIQNRKRGGNSALRISEKQCFCANEQNPTARTRRGWGGQSVTFLKQAGLE